jgi:putative membrane protein
MSAREFPPAAGEPEPRGAESDDVTRRTWLAAERTWLAWWRTGVAASALAIGIGRLLPETTHGARWPFRLLGIAYALLAVAILVVGARRQRRTAGALRRGAYAQLSSPLVMWLTAIAVALSLAAIALVGVSL